MAFSLVTCLLESAQRKLSEHPSRGPKQSGWGNGPWHYVSKSTNPWSHLVIRGTKYIVRHGTFKYLSSMSDALVMNGIQFIF